MLSFGRPAVFFSGIPHPHLLGDWTPELFSPILSPLGMTGLYLLKGIGLGFAIAAPVGPIGLLCIRRSLSGGAALGLATGLGAATADAFYGSIAAFGLTTLSGFLLAQQVWLGLAGGAFLCFLGVRSFLSNSAVEGQGTGPSSRAAAYVSAVFLTLANPMTILSFIGVFAGCGLGATPSYAAAGTLVAGVFCGSTLWWLLLGCGVGRFRSCLDSRWMRMVNSFSGLVLLGFGVAAMAKALRLVCL